MTEQNLKNWPKTQPTNLKNTLTKLSQPITQKLEPIEKQKQIKLIYYTKFKNQTLLLKIASTPLKYT